MRPKVFLSHSKKDRVIIEKIANDLRASGLDVWYDEWEIPVGDSIRKKIFEEGIPNCDAFFVYLTDSSVRSYWVQRELDSAMFRDSEDRNNFLILFVDEDEVRKSLPYDLRSLKIPALNEANYLRPLSQLISKAWQAFSTKVLNNRIKEFEQERLIIEKAKFELEKSLFEIQRQGLVDLGKIKERLNRKRITIDAISMSTFLEVFHKVKFRLADGVNSYYLEEFIKEDLSPKTDATTFFLLYDNKNNFAEFLGELIIQGLVKVIPPTESSSGFNILTDLGLQLAREDESQ